jgi:tripartite-type tricarboxylate transporter receptor subunit TctC
MLSRRRFVAAAAGAGASIAAPRRAHSQVVGRLTRIIVGFAPGGSSDVTARLLVEQMRGYASTIIIDNRPGAGGRIAVETAKAGAPDGSVLLLSPRVHSFRISACAFTLTNPMLSGVTFLF